MSDTKKRRTPEQIAAEHQRKANVFRARARRNKANLDIRNNKLIADSLKKLVEQGDPQSVRVLTIIHATIADDEDRSGLGLKPFADYQARETAFESNIAAAIESYKDCRDAGLSLERPLQNYVMAILKWEELTGELKFRSFEERRKQNLPEVSL